MQTTDVQARVDLRIPEGLKTEIEAAATIAGVSLTKFFTDAALEHAREVRRLHANTSLDNEERDAFMRLLANPPEASPELAKLMQTKVQL